MEAHPFTHKWTQRIHYKYIFIYHGIIQVGTIKLVIHPPDKARAPSELSKNIYLGSSLWRVSSVLSSLSSQKPTAPHQVYVGVWRHHFLLPQDNNVQSMCLTAMYLDVYMPTGTQVG